jgi:hypothetical protein
MNLFRSEEHARRWEQYRPESEEGFISLPELAGFFGTESRRHMLDADYLSRWFPTRATERREYLYADRQGVTLLARHAGRRLSHLGEQDPPPQLR